ncbi:MAG: membrane dipeptidase [Gammaproteobacteria bacterium]|nr:membrane dipeptidase [Gammaproteobacteria bacterium]
MRHRLAITAAAMLAGCSGDDGERARELAQRSLIVDTHIDAPYRLFRQGADLGVLVPERDFDYPRARLGGLDVAFMSIFTPARSADAGESRDVANQLVDFVEALAATHAGKFAIATCTADVERLRGSGRVALALGMENASPLEGTTANLDHFVARGIRYVSLAHSKSNRYADSSFGDFPNLVSGLLERLRRGRHREDLGSEPDARLAGGGAVRRPARLRVEVLSKCHHVASTTRKRVRNTPIAR